MKAELVKGSIADIARQNGQSLATTFISCDVVVIVDTSASMSAIDNDPERRTRYDRACWELAVLQADLPGKVGVISFSDQVMFCANGTPYNFGGSTDLAAALKFAKIADVPGGMRFIVISDGQPDDANGALRVARTFQSRIDTIYCGPEGDYGRDFLERLAAASGGSHIAANQVKELAANVQKLLAA